MKQRNYFTRALTGTAVMGVSLLAFAPAANAADGVGHGDASASTGTGQLFSLLDTGICETDGGAATGRCGDGLNLNNQISAFSQNASGSRAEGTSSADASVAPIDIRNFASLDLTGVIDGVSNADTGTVLDQVLGPLGQALQLVVAPIRAQVIDAIDAALQQALGQLHSQIPLTAEIGAVESRCTAEPGAAEGNGTVAGVNVGLSLVGQQVVRVPLTADTAPNSELVANVPSQVVADVVAGLKETFANSLGGALAPLNALLDQLVTPLTNELFKALEPTLLKALNDGLKSLIHGTVNKQTSSGPGQIEVTSLDLTLLQAAGANAQNLKLARSACGPNRASTPTTPTATPPAAPQPGPAPAETPGASPAVPTKVTSGVSDEGSNAALGFAATGAMLLMAAAYDVMRRRFAGQG